MDLIENQLEPLLQQCAECGAPLPPDRRSIRCAVCAKKRKAEKNRAYQQKLREARKGMAAQCECCGQLLPAGRRGGVCDECAKRRREEQRKSGKAEKKDVQRGKGLRQTVRDLERENARRRTEGKPTLTYGQYVALYNI